MNVALITLDSLRWDVAQLAKTPNIAQLGSWVKAGAPGTYTLPSHTSMIIGGILPQAHDAGPYYDRWEKPLFSYRGIGRPGRFNLPGGSASIPDGFARMGYKTIGFGGVGWFSSERATSQFWAREFERWHWRSEYHENEPGTLEKQFRDFVAIRKRATAGQNHFIFWNVAATHWPYMAAYKGIEDSYTVERQVKALECFDSRFSDILDHMPKPLVLVLCSDHGDVMWTEVQSGVAERVGHGYSHPLVWDVPMMIVEVR